MPAPTLVADLVAILRYDVRGRSELAAFRANLKSITSGFDSFVHSFGNFVGITGAAVGASLGLTTRGLIKTNVEMERFQIRLETLTGSQEKAKESFGWIREFALKSPYQISEIIEGYTRLQAYGIDPTNGSLEILQDTASGMGRTLKQAIEAFADAGVGEFERLKEFGIKGDGSKKDSVVFTWTENSRNMRQEVAKNSQAIREFLKDLLGRRFGGASAKLATTLEGITNNLKDWWYFFKVQIGQSGVLEKVKHELLTLYNTLSEFTDTAQYIRWANVVSHVLITVVDLIKAFAFRLANHARWIYNNWNQVKGMFKTVGIILGWFVLRAFPVIYAIGAIGLAVEDLLVYLQGGESVFGDFVEWIRDVTGVSDEAAKKLAAVSFVVLGLLGALFIFRAGTVFRIAIGIIAGIAKAIRMLAFLVLLAFLPGSWLVKTLAKIFLRGFVGKIIGVGLAAMILWYFKEEIAKWPWQIRDYLVEAFKKAVEEFKKWWQTFTPMQDIMDYYFMQEGSSDQHSPKRRRVPGLYSADSEILRTINHWLGKSKRYVERSIQFGLLKGDLAETVMGLHDKKGMLDSLDPARRAQTILQYHETGTFPGPMGGGERVDVNVNVKSTQGTAIEETVVEGARSASQPTSKGRPPVVVHVSEDGEYIFVTPGSGRRTPTDTVVPELPTPDLAPGPGQGP